MIDLNVINQPVTILGLNPDVLAAPLLAIPLVALATALWSVRKRSADGKAPGMVAIGSLLVAGIAGLTFAAFLVAYDSSPQRTASSREHDRGIDLVTNAIYDTYDVDNVDTKALRYPISSGKTTLEHIIVESDPAELPMIEVEIDGQWYEYPVSFDNDAGEVTLYPDTRSVNNYPVPAEFKIEN